MLDKRFEDLEKKIAFKLRARNDRFLYESDLLVFGLTSRAISLYKGMKESQSNPYVFVILFRAQIETLATINHLIRNPSDIKKFLHGGRKDTKFKITNVLTLIDACAKNYPKLREIYDEISEMAHPNSASHYLSIDKGENKLSWRSKPTFSDVEKDKALKGLAEINEYVANDLEQLIDQIVK